MGEPRTWLVAWLLVSGCSCPAPHPVSSADMARLNQQYCVVPTTSAVTAEQSAALTAVHTARGPMELPSSASSDPPELPDVARVDEALGLIREEHLLDPDNHLRFGQVANDCERRAHVAAAYLLSAHPRWLVGKLFVSDDSHNLVGGSVVPWGYHVAPYVLSLQDGQPVIRVLDGAVSDRSLSPSEWTALIAERPGDATLTVRDVRALYLDDALAPAAQFCDSVDSARRELQSRRDCGERHREGLRVGGIDHARGRVWFREGAATDAPHTGWFSYRSDLGDELDVALETQEAVTAEYELVEIHGGNFLRLVGVATAPSRCRPRR